MPRSWLRSAGRFENVGQHVQVHFGADPFERIHLEVRRSHLRLDGTERVFDRLPPLAHLLRVLVEPPLNGLENLFVFPAADSALLARGVTGLDGAVSAGVGPSKTPRARNCAVSDSGGQLLSSSKLSQGAQSATLTTRIGEHLVEIG